MRNAKIHQTSVQNNTTETHYAVTLHTHTHRDKHIYLRQERGLHSANIIHSWMWKRSTWARKLSVLQMTSSYHFRNTSATSGLLLLEDMPLNSILLTTRTFLTWDALKGDWELVGNHSHTMTIYISSPIFADLKNSLIKVSAAYFHDTVLRTG